ncbi:MAG: hypothetical protein BGO39_27815 [Chloroflexi bacterium 54-19]|nr:MAG: hypothetical protein BGO39_27815 [Chloroflexi bacterium 54-19]
MQEKTKEQKKENLKRKFSSQLTHPIPVRNGVSQEYKNYSLHNFSRNLWGKDSGTKYNGK